MSNFKFMFLVTSCLFVANDACSDNISSQFMLRINELEESNRMLVGKSEEFQSKIAALENKIKILESQALDNYDKAQNNKKQVEEELQESSETTIKKTEKLLEEKKYKAAIEKLNDFLASKKNDVYRGQAFFFLGTAYEKLGNSKKAITAYLNSIKERPNGAKSPIAMLNAAKLFEKIGKKDKAICILKKAINTYSDKKDIVKNAQTALNRLEKK